MIKKFLVVLSILLIATPSFAADLSADGLTVADLLARGRGRAIGISDSVVMSVWYTGTASASFGITGATGDIYIFEDGVATTTIPGMAIIWLSPAGPNTTETATTLSCFTRREPSGSRSAIFRMSPIGRHTVPGPRICGATSSIA